MAGLSCYCFLQQESPSAEMVMLERLFLQSERLSLGEDRRRARRDPGIKAQDSFVCLFLTSFFSLRCSCNSIKQGS